MGAEPELGHERNFPCDDGRAGSLAQDQRVVQHVGLGTPTIGEPVVKSYTSQTRSQAFPPLLFRKRLRQSGTSDEADRKRLTSGRPAQGGASGIGRQHHSNLIASKRCRGERLPHVTPARVTDRRLQTHAVNAPHRPNASCHAEATRPIDAAKWAKRRSAFDNHSSVPDPKSPFGEQWDFPDGFVVARNLARDSRRVRQAELPYRWIKCEGGGGGG